MKRPPDVQRLLDRQGRLRTMPVRPDAKAAVLAFLVEKFERSRRYTEREVNDLLDAWHTFGDHTRLRRELCDAALLTRHDDGSSYWRT
jgi:hypothetical protein